MTGDSPVTGLYTNKIDFILFDLISLENYPCLFKFKNDFFCGSFILFLSCFRYVMLACTSVHWCLVVTCWERTDLFALVCNV